MASQSALNAHGAAAGLIAESWWVMLWGSGAILLLVFALLAAAIWRRGGDTAARGNFFIVAGGLALPVVALTALLLYQMHVARALTRPESPDLRVEVLGRQFAWEARYPGSGVVSTNEIYIPANRRVELVLETADVIHSFWVPSLAGKMDLIPGQRNRLIVSADAPGVFSGQCAEFCGTFHAHMRLRVIALDPREFDDWLDRTRRAGPAR